MNRFDYVRATSIAHAVTAASAPGAAYIAGGTNLLDLMKGNIVRPTRLVDISRLGMDEIERLDDGSWRIGALARNADLAHDREFAAACNKREPGAGCAALGGEGRLAAIIGWSDACIATHPSDFCVPLAAFDAVLDIAGPAGTREVALEAFHLLPGSDPSVETVLAPGELITAIRLPASSAAFAAHARYIKVRERTSYAFAVVAAAAGLVLETGKITQARLAFGSIAAKPWRSRSAEQSLIGAAPHRNAFRAAAEIALADAKPPGDGDFKIELARRLAVRALSLAAAGTPPRVAALPASLFAAGVHHA
jgi:xanthine dehydrogenase YagS FAD-binding subunit